MFTLSLPTISYWFVAKRHVFELARYCKLPREKYTCRPSAIENSPLMAPVGWACPFIIPTNVSSRTNRAKRNVLFRRSFLLFMIFSKFYKFKLQFSSSFNHKFPVIHSAVMSGCLQDIRPRQHSFRKCNSEYGRRFRSHFASEHRHSKHIADFNRQHP